MFMQKSNITAARSGNVRDALVALRDTLATMLDTTEAQIHAQLAAQYRATLADIAALDAAQPPVEVSALDEITARRKGRDGASPDRLRAAGHRKSGDG